MTVAPARLSANHWPGLDVVPTGPRAAVSSRVARRLFRAAVARLDVSVVTGAETLGKGGPVMVMHRPEEFYARIGRDQLIGFGEAYLTGAWDAEDLGAFLTVLSAEIADLIPQSLQRMRALIVKRPPRWQRSSAENSRDNIAHHYDLSNDLFEVFLDPTLSYSSALFASDEPAPLAAVTRADLESAQVRKIERLLDQSAVTHGSRVLEIGSGWGELAIRAARRGASVRTITLSTEQQSLARERVAAAGVSHLVDVELCDYRAVTGEYDAVLSVEMVEAVGWQYWQTYFETIDRVLAPGGRASIQAITMPHDRMLATRNTYTWIHKYIFPGGFLPSVEVIEQITADHTAGSGWPTGCRWASTTPRRCGCGTRPSWSRARRSCELGFDATFLRMWHFYLEYSRAGFASGYIDVNQLTFHKELA